jgi:hypothetical protein
VVLSEKTKQQKESKVAKVMMADRAARTVRVMADDGTESTLTVEGLEAQPKAVRLSEVKRDGEGKFDFTSLPHDGDVLIAGEVIHAMQVQGELDAAVKDGKITPAQRPHFERLALSDLPAFREIVKTMPKQVDTTERGHSGGGAAGGIGELSQVEARLFAAVAEKQKGRPEMQYHEALKLVASEQPELNRRYTELVRKRTMGRDE